MACAFGRICSMQDFYTHLSLLLQDNTLHLAILPLYKDALSRNFGPISRSVLLLLPLLRAALRFATCH